MNKLQSQFINKYYQFHQTFLLSFHPFIYILDDKYNIFSMKFLFTTAALLALCSSQQVTNFVFATPVEEIQKDDISKYFSTKSQDIALDDRPPISQPIEIQVIDIISEINKMIPPPPGPMPGSEEFNPTSFQIEKKPEENKLYVDPIEIIVPPGPMPGSEEFNPSSFHPQHQIERNGEGYVDPDVIFVPPGPMPGSQEFNPTSFHPNQFNKMRRKDHKERKQHSREKNHKSKQNHGNRNVRREEDVPDQLDFQGWEKRMQKSHRKGKYHKNMGAKLLFVAILFTLIGFLISKTIRKIRKCKQRKMKKLEQQRKNQTTKTSSAILSEIKENQERLNKLLAEYQAKKNEEEKLAEQRRVEQIFERQNQLQMRQVIQPQPQGYFQNSLPVGIPVQSYY